MAPAGASRTGLRGLTQQARKGKQNLLAGPAARPKTPLAVENSVGELTAGSRKGYERQMSAVGKESVASSHSHLKARGVTPSGFRFFLRRHPSRLRAHCRVAASPPPAGPDHLQLPE
jgi:hypothetical protein